MSTAISHPKLRHVEARSSPTQSGAIDIFDRSGISRSVITLSGAALFIVSRMDGRHSRADIQAAYLLRHGTMLFSNELDHLIEQLDESLLLCGPRFERHLNDLTSAYRAAEFRPLRDVESLGAPKHGLKGFLDEVLHQNHRQSGDQHGGDPGVFGKRTSQKVGSKFGSEKRLLGFVAPHLDYARGAPCYAAAYDAVLSSCDARRFIILGTNHYGRGNGSVVGTCKGFETPGGIVRCDAEFMGRMNRRCGVDLCEFEYDHAREHSIELQAVLLRHVLPDRDFSIVSYLCHDPCGPSGTGPHEGRGVDLRDFAIGLREEIAGDSVPTCIIASADLSHVGRYFQDDHDLNDEYLKAIAKSDHQALSFVAASDPEGFRKCIAVTNNATSICSVGCMYALATALGESARPEMLYYHQAVLEDIENCVSCAAAAYFMT